MGKTIMVSALIHTNSEPELNVEDATPAKRARQLKLDDAFRPIMKSAAAGGGEHSLF